MTIEQDALRADLRRRGARVVFLDNFATLCAVDLIRREPHPKDRRVWLLYLRPEARPLLDRMREIGIATKAEALMGISEADRERLIEILSTMKTNLLNATSRPSAERSASHG